MPAPQVSRIGAALAAAIAIACAGSPPGSEDGRSVLLLVAASAADAGEAAAREFTARTGVEVRVSAGPSNALANQILAGAPADVFLSANPRWAEAVRAGGHAEATRLLLGNDLVLVVPAGNPAGVRGPHDLLGPGVRRVALAGEHVPAGDYAEQALDAVGVLRPLQRAGRLARGGDVRIALSYVERAEAEAGIVYATDARLTTRVETVYRFPPETHDAVVYPLLLVRRTGRGADAPRLYEFLRSADAARIFEQFGFTVLDEAPRL